MQPRVRQWPQYWNFAISLDSPEEQERLKRLHELNILDTMPEEAYDDITFLAARLAETPIALITMVDEFRQWFKAKVGVNISETPRDQAFCARAIKSRTSSWWSAMPHWR